MKSLLYLHVFAVLREMEMGELQDRVAMVTGAAGGIGKAVAERLAREGATVVLLDIDEEGTQRVSNLISHIQRVPTFPASCDVTDPVSVYNVVSAVKQRHGHIDILVNAAADRTPRTFHEITVDDWDRVMDAHVKGTIIPMDTVLRARAGVNREGKPDTSVIPGLRVVNILPILATEVPGWGGAHHSAAYRAVISLTESYAVECGADNVRVNAIAPGLVDIDAISHRIPPETLQWYSESSSRGRLVTPEELAETVLFLVSDRSDFVTGTVIPVGGRDLV